MGRRSSQKGRCRHSSSGGGSRYWIQDCPDIIPMSTTTTTTTTTTETVDASSSSSNQIDLMVWLTEAHLFDDHNSNNNNNTPKKVTIDSKNDDHPTDALVNNSHNIMNSCNKESENNNTDSIRNKDTLINIETNDSDKMKKTIHLSDNTGIILNDVQEQRLINSMNLDTKNIDVIMTPNIVEKEEDEQEVCNSTTLNLIRIPDIPLTIENKKLYHDEDTDLNDNHHHASCNKDSNPPTICIKRVSTSPNNSAGKQQPHQKQQQQQHGKKRKTFTSSYIDLPNGNNGDGIINPYPESIVLNKYWAQRHRLFTKYDNGIQLDHDGWFSVTPEVIANHITQKMIQNHYYNNNNMTNQATSSSENKMIVLDAFVGMGGNTIAFGLRNEVSLVICADTCIERLQLAANNCAIYQIPFHKILFFHINVCRILSCYANGYNKQQQKNEEDKQKQLNQKDDSDIINALHNDEDDNDHCINVQEIHGYKCYSVHEGCTNLQLSSYLPQELHAIFLSPPWGGIEYESIGPRHFQLDMIKLESSLSSIDNSQNTKIDHSTIPTDIITTSDDVVNQSNNSHPINNHLVNGEELLYLSCQALANYTSNNTVTTTIKRHLNIGYFLPRNLNGLMFTQTIALTNKCRIRGMIEIEQNIVNHKFKTITVYINSSNCQEEKRK